MYLAADRPTHIPYSRQQWMEGYHKTPRLYRKIVQQGYGDAERQVRKAVHPWRSAQGPGGEAVGTCFPLTFDDVTSFTTKTFEDLAKSHWETNCTEEDQFSQLVFTSNILNLKEWAKSRMKRIDFDVHFVPNTRTQGQLASILEKPSPLYRWFAREYEKRLSQPGWLQDDELATSACFIPFSSRAFLIKSPKVVGSP